MSARISIIVALLMGISTEAAAGSQCFSYQDWDKRNLCLAKESKGNGGMYCSKIRNADLNKYCEATVIRRSKAMCGFIKNKALQERCKAELR